MNRYTLIVVLALICLVSTLPLRAEFPALERAIKNEIATFSKQLELRTVLVAVDETISMDASWNVLSAIETEIVYQLKQNNIVVTDNDSDQRYEWLNRPNASGVRRFQKKPHYDYLVACTFSKKGDGLTIHLAAYDQNDSTPVLRRSIPLGPRQLQLTNNIPRRNLNVARYASASRGKKVGDGRNITVIKEALSSTASHKIGVFKFGRRLGPGEAILPGDILHFEKARLEGKHHSKPIELERHSAIVSEVESKSRVQVLHQDFDGQEKKRIRRDSLELNELRWGVLVVFRPVDKDPVLPRDELPYRKLPAKVTADTNGKIDLLKTIDPELDTVSGVWNRVGDQLTNQHDRFVSIQIPVDVPKAYVIRANVKRTFGDNAFVIVFMIDGRQAMVTMDGYSDNQTYGMGLIDGKKGSINETTGHKKVLPLNQMVPLEVIVRPGSVILKADQVTLVDWQGDTKRLTMNPLWALSNPDLLHLGSWYSEFEITKLTLEPLKDK